MIHRENLTLHSLTLLNCIQNPPSKSIPNGSTNWPNVKDMYYSKIRSLPLSKGGRGFFLCFGCCDLLDCCNKSNFASSSSRRRQLCWYISLCFLRAALLTAVSFASPSAASEICFCTLHSNSNAVNVSS
jgi:hypothetical protein